MTDGPYQIEGEDHILNWLAGEPSPDARKAMFDWVPLLSINPIGAATAQRLDRRLPIYVAQVPGTDAFVDYTVVEQYRTVRILGAASHRPEDLRDLS